MLKEYPILRAVTMYPYTVVIVSSDPILTSCMCIAAANHIDSVIRHSVSNLGLCRGIQTRI